MHAEAEDPVDLLRRRGLKGGLAAGGIPAWSTKKESESSPFFVQAGVEQGGSKKHLWIIHFKDGRLRYDGGIRFCVE